MPWWCCSCPVATWLWSCSVTTLPKALASTGAVVQLGHSRWSIENHGFNERVNRWHADPVYKHQATAMRVFCLIAMICLNVFTTFHRRNIQPAARRAASTLHMSGQIAAELRSGVPIELARDPP